MTSARELHIAGLVAVTVLAGLTGLAGCDLAGPGSGETDSGYVVEAYLVAERSLPPVRLSRTAGIEEVYRPTERGVSDPGRDRTSGSGRDAGDPALLPIGSG